MNKEIAARLGMAEKTTKVHRGHVIRKMKVRSLAELAEAPANLFVPHIA